MVRQQSNTSLLGPDNEAILSQHLFTTIWEGNVPELIKIRYHYHMHGLTVDDCIRPYIVLVDLHGVTHLGTGEHQSCSGGCSDIPTSSRDPHFYWPMGEWPWQLGMLWSFSFRGLTVDLLHDWRTLRYKLLGLILYACAFHWASLKLSWLWKHFGDGPLPMPQTTSCGSTDELILLRCLGAYYLSINQATMLGFSYYLCFTILTKHAFPHRVAPHAHISIYVAQCQPPVTRLLVLLFSYGC